MGFSTFTDKKIEDLFRLLETGKDGLANTEAHARLQKYGPNIIGSQQTYWWQVLLRQFKSPFLYLLIAAAGISYFLGEKIDASMILLFVSINTTLGFYQEYHSERTLKLLKKFIRSQDRVVRAGKEMEVDSSELVPGDIILLEAGDVVPADVRIIEETNVTVDESVLTGESVAVRKTPTELSTEVKEMYQATNICFSGTTIASGEAKGVVFATGRSTVLGQITKLTVETHRQSSFEKGIARFSRFILYLILTTLAGIFCINIFLKGAAVNVPELLIFSIALAVSVIPEALPVVITFSLSRGALRLARSKVVVKRLSAIEDLGSIEVLCTDKTGTLTENQLTLQDSLALKKDEDVLVDATLASTLRKNKNQSVHSFDITLLNSLSEPDKKKMAQYERVKEIPFDPVRKRSSMIVKKNSHYQLIVRGALEEIEKLCVNLTIKEKHEITKWTEKEKGNRIIAVARKEISYSQEKDPDEKGLEFVGLISFIDPIKKTVNESIQEAKQLNVQIKVLTGDSREVAGIVAHKISLITDPTEVLTGDEFDNLSEHDQHEAVLKYHVFARVSPQQKYNIIQLLEEKYEVGFLGEGINDAPALKIANVALVVQNATDVAREAADIILLKKSLRVIIDGIKEGRETFANTSKYIRATLSSNFGNFYTVAISSLFVTYLPLLPLQILLINLLTDFPMIAVATDTIDVKELKSPRTYEIKEIVLIGTILGVVSTVFDFVFFALFYKISPQVLQTNWFIGSVLTELLFLFSIRTRLPVYKAKLPSAPLIILTSAAFLTAIVLPFTMFGHNLFKFISPSRSDLLTILIIVVCYFVSTELMKLLYYKLISGKGRLSFV